MVLTNRLLTRLKRQEQAWSELASADEFAGLSLAGFNAEIMKLQAARDRLLAAETALKSALKGVRIAAKDAMSVSKRVALGMKSHPTHGEDSEVVRASGFITESERRSGLTRKRKAAESTAGAPA
jgi:hypothetical protein